MPAPIARSYLFVPGNRPERFAKACAAGAHAVIIDMEDAVPPGEKVAARAAVAGWVTANTPVYIRINAADTEWFADDLTLCGRPGVAGIVLPKAERVEDLARLASAGVPAILPLIESARGFWNVQAIAGAPKVQRLVFGTIDFSFDMGMLEGPTQLLPYRSQLVLVSRVAGIAAPVDGVTTALDDAALITADTQHARELGFGGKLCIHPKQVAHVNRGFAPSADALAWAMRVRDAAAA
ncbi:MAG: CoA ester lyase, partial [Herminiimonas sp.]|nr:CoA ester lyase [Herminiimonas sp.]